MQAAASQQIVAAPVKVKTSQQAVIDQLHQQSQQNDSLILLHGSEGSGKSTIAELFLEQASEYAECAFVSVSERATVDRLRAQILNQLFGTISLSDETLSRQIQRQAPLHHAIVVLDNGHNLPDSFLAECVAAVSQLSALGQKVSIVVAADSRWAYQQKPAPHLRVQGPVMVEVQPLNTDEQVRFIQSLLPDKQQRLWNFDRIQQFLTTINGYPGEIQQRLQLALATQAQRYKDTPQPAEDFQSALDEEQVSLSDSSSSTTASTGRTIKVGWLLLIALLISVSLVAYLNRATLLESWQPTTDDKTAAELATTEPSTAADTPNSEETVELPRFEPLSAQTLELKPEDLTLSYREALDDLNRVAAASNDPRELDLKLIATEPSDVAATPETAELPYQTNAISERDANRYALQIAVISTESLLGEFRRDYDLTNSTEVYQREDGAYVIILGNFTSLAAAREGVSQLPSNVQALEPWAKSFAAMQAELPVTNAQ